MGAIRMVVLVVLAACRVHDVDLEGKACPCPAGWYCNAATQTCTATRPIDATVPPDGPRTYRAAVIADAPISYWRLGDTGSTAKDEMGANDGTYKGTCMTGVGGALVGDANPAVKFDGSSCEIDLPDRLGFPNKQPFSVEVWAEADAAAGPTTFPIPFSKESRTPTTGPVDGYALVDSSMGYYLERIVGMSLLSTPPVAHPLHRFQHLVGVYDGATVVLYVDGAPTAPVMATAVMPVYSAAPVIGGDSTGDFFFGALDEVAVYDHALPADRVLVHYMLGSSP